jgi:hypothetical protein
VASPWHVTSPVAEPVEGFGGVGVADGLLGAEGTGVAERDEGAEGPDEVAGVGGGVIGLAGGGSGAPSAIENETRTTTATVASELPATAASFRRRLTW